MKITSKNVLRFVLYIAALEANSGCGQNGNVGPYSNRKIKCDPYVRLKHLAFSFSGSETLSKRRPDVYKKTRRYRRAQRQYDTSQKFKVEQFPFIFGIKKELINKEYLTPTGEIDQTSLPSWAKDITSADKRNKQVKANEISRKFLNAKHVEFLMNKKNESAINSNVADTMMPLASLIEVNDLLMASRQEWTVAGANDTKSHDTNNINGDYVSENENPLGIPRVEEIGNWDFFFTILQQSMKDLLDTPAENPSFDISVSAEQVLKDATQQVETFLHEASASFSPEKVHEMLSKASLSLEVDENADVFKSTMDGIVAIAETMARDNGVDVSEAAKRARATTSYTSKFLHAANGLLLSGYVNGGNDMGDIDVEVARELNIPLSERSENVRPLFSDYVTAHGISKDEYAQTLKKGAEMAELAGSVYIKESTVIDKLGHVIVANGTTADVSWLVTDSVGYEDDYIPSTQKDTERKPILIRTVTIRGYDASDETVDRERLMNRLCTANPVHIGKRNKNVKFHGGLLGVAQEIYAQISPLINFKGPAHKIVLNGHSIGGSLSLLLLFLLTENHGDAFVREKVLRTYTFGSIPIAIFNSTEGSKESTTECPILNSYGLPTSIVYGYVQPWDPIVRLFSPIDAMYPLVGDLGEDGVSLYASGPNRALRPIIRSILQSWEGWPTLRENLLDPDVVQDYESVGTQHLLLPDRSRYLTDRLLTVNVGAPPLAEVIRISSGEMYSALEDIFPLDTFSISVVPAAIRSFIHHFYPAYDECLREYVMKTTPKEKHRTESYDKKPLLYAQ